MKENWIKNNLYSRKYIAEESLSNALFFALPTLNYFTERELSIQTNLATMGKCSSTSSRSCLVNMRISQKVFAFTVAKWFSPKMRPI